MRAQIPQKTSSCKRSNIYDSTF